MQIYHKRYIYIECKRRGITILSFGVDGDSQLTKVMKETTLHHKFDHKSSFQAFLKEYSVEEDAGNMQQAKPEH